MYDILGKFNNLDPKLEPVKETKAKETVYEEVEARGDIMEAVRSLEEKYMGFKKTVAAVKKGGSAEDPEAVAASIGRKKYGKKKFQKAAAQGKKLGEAAKPDYIDLDKDGNKTEPMKKAAKDAKKKAVKEGQGPYELYNPKHPKFKANYEKYKKSHPDCTIAEFVAAMKKKEHSLKEGEYDPAPIDPAAVEKRKRLQAIKDRQEAEREHGSDHKSNVRTIKGKAYGGAAQKDDADDLDEVAPPGAKAERMVKHIKKGYAKDGKLSKKEKGIAYATAWKAHNKGKLQESRMIQEGDYFYEKLGKALAEKNPTLNTADSSFVTAVRQEMIAQGMEPNRARNIIMTDEDFISDVATSYGHYCKEIAECGAPMNSYVDGNLGQELDEIAALAGLPVKQKVGEMETFPNAPKNASKTPAPPKLPVKETDVYNEINHEESSDTMDEAMGSSVTINGKPVDVSSIEVDGVNDWDAPDFADAYVTYAQYADGTPLSDDELDQLTDEHGDLVNQAAHGSLQGRADFVDEDTMGEGNEFSGALAKAKAAGAKEFEVDGKKYTVKEGQVNEDATITVSATLEDDAINMLRRLAGMQSNEAQSAATDDKGQELGLEEERDIEHLNTPREKVAPADAAYPSGTDMHRAKKSYSDKPYRGDNPMAVKENADDSLWKKYTGMLKSLILK